MKLKYFLTLIILLIVPLQVKAFDVDYDIKNYYIEANIKENGDLDVSELIVLDGSFNGYVRDIKYKNSKLKETSDIDFANSYIYNAKDVSNLEIYGGTVYNAYFEMINDNDFTLFDRVSSASNGSKKKYEISSISDGYSFKMYYRTSSNKTAFLIKYTLKNVVVLHDDVAELYWTFIGEDYSDPINNLEIRVNLPSSDYSDLFRVWAHGNLNGEIYKYENNQIIASIDYLNAHELVDVRATFDKDLMDETTITKSSNETALDKILVVEQERADEANRIRQRNEKIIKVFKTLGLVSIIWQIISIFYIRNKYDKEYKSDFTNDYYRDFIEDYNVEVVDYIMKKGITPNAMSASIMNLIYKKNISATQFYNKKNEEYTFTLLNKDNLKEAEEVLVNFLFNIIGNGKEFSTVELKSYAKSTKTYDKFTATYTVWQKEVIMEGKRLNIFEKHTNVIIYSVLYFIIHMIVSTIILSIGAYSISLFFSQALSFGVMMYCICFYRRTIYGNEQFVRWKAFKKFLNDFGDFKTKELPEVILWERYLVYATVFGIADKISKVMNVKIKEMEAISGTSTYYPYFYHTNIARVVNSSVNKSITSAQSTAASQASSGSGSGGGFSSGGGFGGGGGGGHGF